MQKIIFTLVGIFSGLGICIAQQAGLSTSKTMPNLNANHTVDIAMVETVATEEIDWENFEKYLEVENEKSVFFFNETMQLLFVDLEEIYEQYNYATDLQSIQIRTADNKVIFSDNDLDKLPSNAIYEIDLSTYPQALYRVEVVATHQAPLSYELMKK